MTRDFKNKHEDKNGVKVLEGLRMRDIYVHEFDRCVFGTCPFFLVVIL